MTRVRWTSRTWRAPKGDGKRSRESAWLDRLDVDGGVRRYAQGYPWFGHLRNEQGPPMRRRVDAKRWVECEVAKGVDGR